MDIEKMLGDISEGVKGISGGLSSLEKRVETLEKKPASDETVKALQSKLDSMEASQKSVAIVTPEMMSRNKENEKVKFYRDLFGALIRKDYSKLETMQKASDTYHFNETIAGGSGNLGYFIPQEWSENIVDFTVNYQNRNSVLPFVTMLPMNRHILNVQEYLDGITAGMISAGTAITDSTSSGSQSVLTAEKIACLVNYDNETLADINPAILRTIENAAANAFAYRMNYVTLTGSGAEDYNNCGITGILNATGTNVVTMAASGYATVSVKDLADMIDGITVDIDQGVFVFPKALRAVIRTLKDEQGYIWKPNGNDIETIWGFPVIWVNGILPSAPGANTKFGIFGDLRKGVVWGDRMSLEVSADTSVRFDKYQTAVRWVRRADAVVFGKAFSVLKTHA